MPSGNCHLYRFDQCRIVRICLRAVDPLRHWRACAPGHRLLLSEGIKYASLTRAGEHKCGDQHLMPSIPANGRWLYVARCKWRAHLRRCSALGIMTFHRWRKARRELAASKDYAATRVGEGHPPPMVELRLENERLRRIVADLELDRARLQEQVAILSGRSFIPIQRRRPAFRRRRRSPVHRRAAS